MHIEDVIAFNTIESFLTQHDQEAHLFGVQVLENNEGGGWFPDEAEEEIERWEGHVVYVCNKSISPRTWEKLESQGFPFFIQGVGLDKPEIQHIRKNDIKITSPMDASTPLANDFAIIGKFNRGEGKGKGYIISGIRGIGTLGAASLIVDSNKLLPLSHISAADQFAVVVEAQFDIDEFKVTNALFHTAAETF